MTTLAANKPRAYELGDINEIPVIAADILYEGAAAGDNGSGYARPLVAGDPFIGFVEKNVDNSAGAAAAKKARLITRGKIQVTLTGVALTDVGRPVWASDDDTFTLTPGVNSYIGRVHRYVAANTAVVDFAAVGAGVKPRAFVLALPVTLAQIAGAGDVLTAYTPGFAGRILKTAFAVTSVVTTAAKLATLNLEIGTTNVTGGEIALTSALCTPLGAVIAGAAVTAANYFGATDTISVEASSVTAFVEGAGVLLLTIEPVA